MPLPHYIIGALVHSEDKTTGLVSYFQVIEKLSITAYGGVPPALAKAAPDSFRIFIAASWMRGEGEERAVSLDSEWWMQVPGKSLPELLHEHKFQIDDQFARLTLHLGFGPKNPTSGVAYVENRIRASGTGDPWLIQKFPFWLEFTIIPAEEGEPTVPPSVN
jgi:hypothetical protein